MLQYTIQKCTLIHIYSTMIIQKNQIVPGYQMYSIINWGRISKFYFKKVKAQQNKKLKSKHLAIQALPQFVNIWNQKQFQHQKENITI